MADTRNDVPVPSKQWVDIYALSGIAVGTAVVIINKGSNSFYVSAQATSPAAVTSGAPKGVPVYPCGIFGSTISVASSAAGLWAYCADTSGSIAVVQE